VPGEAVARLLKPADDGYFVLKPKHSAFFETTVDTLLSYLGATTLILTGSRQYLHSVHGERRLYARLDSGVESHIAGASISLLGLIPDPDEACATDQSS
jgi:hypothetical protein